VRAWQARPNDRVPGVVQVLAARARTAGAPARGRTLAGDGVWIAIDASPLLDRDGAMAIVLRPAPAPSVLDGRLRAAGLTDRERDIALTLLRGDDTATIAATLHLSPWIVQDHLKAIFDKDGRALTAGVRGEVGAGSCRRGLGLACHSVTVPIQPVVVVADDLDRPLDVLGTVAAPACAVVVGGIGVEAGAFVVRIAVAGALRRGLLHPLSRQLLAPPASSGPPRPLAAPLGPPLCGYRPATLCFRRRCTSAGSRAGCGFAASE
jgi:DNA-binding CsgD family transcriptional regulator